MEAGTRAIPRDLRVSLRTGEPGIIVGLDNWPTALAITPDGRTLYVTTSGMEGDDGQAGPNSVTAIDTTTSQVRASLTWRAQPMYLTMAPNRKTVWVVSITGAEETTADNTVTPVNVATDQPGPSLHTSGWLNYQDSPSAAAISPRQPDPLRSGPLRPGDLPRLVTPYSRGSRGNF